MKMRKAMTICAAALLLTTALDASAQMNISTKKERISDFPVKTTKVVMSGNEIFNVYYKEEIARRWVISPYEFCSEQEYEKLRTDSNYYFLVPVTSRHRKEIAPGIAELLLHKGGSEDSDNEQMDIISVPYASSEDPDGREFTFLPAIIDLIQGFTTDALKSDKVMLAGLGTYAIGNAKLGKSRIAFSESDIAPSVQALPEWKDMGLEILSDEEQADLVDEAMQDCLVSYTVSPSSPHKGSVCYKMLFSARDHKLCYFAKHVIGPSAGTGFLPKDFKIFLAGRK